MKKFFRNSCLDNADNVFGFFGVCFVLGFAWQLIMSGNLFLQILAVLIVLYFVITSIIGIVLEVIDCIRRIIDKKKTAPTEVSADS